MRALTGGYMPASEMFRLDGQRAVVAGASKDIGRGIALCLAEAGADLIIAGRNQAALNSVKDEIAKCGRRVSTFAGDLTDETVVDRLGYEAAEWFGAPTIWVNNVGAKPDIRKRPLADVDPGNFQAEVNATLKSVCFGVRTAASRLETGGCIVNISSLAARARPVPGHALYGALKSAVNSLTRSLSAELAPRIRVNAIAPGSIISESFFGATNLTSAQLQEAMPRLGIQLGRYGQPQDIGLATVFLASPAASWITGQCLYVDGGA
jgi:7-alpha-hydroxysteroid dehydrogenase